MQRHIFMQTTTTSIKKQNGGSYSLMPHAMVSKLTTEEMGKIEWMQNCNEFTKLKHETKLYVLTVVKTFLIITGEVGCNIEGGFGNGKSFSNS